MIFSKANLLVSRAASVKGGRRALRGVRIEKDGTTVATDGTTIVAVEPANPELVTLPSQLIGTRVILGESGMVLPVDMFTKTLKALSKDRRLSLQHASLVRTSDPGKVGLVSLDAAGNTSIVQDSPLQLEYPDWRSSLIQSKDEEYILRVCVNRKAFLDLISLVDEMCSTTPNIFLEIDIRRNTIVFRGVNSQTGQRVIGACPALDTAGQWLPKNAWEQVVLSPPGTGDAKKVPDQQKSHVVVKPKVKRTQK